MDVVIAGGHGQIALRLSTLLTGQGHTVRSIVRNPDHTDDVAATGASPVVADLEKISATDLAGHLTGADAVVFAVERYGSELTQVITHTIERWDGKEAAERIELHVGRDLQFIRINGTIVGGLVGVLIHTVVVLL